MLDMAMLGLLDRGASHGYDLFHRLMEMGFWRISFGSVYPALRRLEQAGYVEEVPTPGRRKEYRLTKTGRSYFHELVADDSAPVDNSSAFRIRLSFLGVLEPEQRIELLERRTGVLLQRVEAIEETLAADDDLHDQYMRSEMGHRADVTRREIEWLESLIEHEQTSAVAQKKGTAS